MGFLMGLFIQIYRLLKNIDFITTLPNELSLFKNVEKWKFHFSQVFSIFLFREWLTGSLLGIDSLMFPEISFGVFKIPKRPFFALFQDFLTLFSRFRGRFPLEDSMSRRGTPDGAPPWPLKTRPGPGDPGRLRAYRPGCFPRVLKVPPPG